MTFVELVKVISRRNNVSYATTRGIIDAYNSAIVSALMEDGKTFAIPGLGRLSVKVRGERNGVNPRPGKRLSFRKERPSLLPARRASRTASTANNIFCGVVQGQHAGLTTPK